jgi:excisionase family DNA binding protein
LFYHLVYGIIIKKFYSIIQNYPKRGAFMLDKIDGDRWVSLQEICEYLGVNRHTIMRWIEQRNMPASKVGKLWRFKTADVDEWVRSGGASDEQEGGNS